MSDYTQGFLKGYRDGMEMAARRIAQDEALTSVSDPSVEAWTEAMMPNEKKTAEVLSGFTKLGSTESTVVRQFESGANRDTNDGKYEYARFFDPKVMEARAAYMHKNRLLRDGSMRDPDNWKKGIPTRAYMDGLFRHLVDVWLLYDYGQAVRPETGEDVDLVDALCAIMFNAEGWLHTLLTEQQEPE